VNDKPSGASFERLVEIMATLRGPEGCPWDKEQDLDTLKPMLIEEVYEVIDAVENRDYDGLSEELGDLLLHIVFHARLGEESGRFAINDVVEGICEKLIRRHPHVFGDEDASDSEQVLANWEAIKRQEKKEKEIQPEGTPSVLDGIPATLPALHQAHKISSRVARVGFDWPHIEDVFGKLTEEITELREAIGRPAEERSQEEIEGEVGDAFFVLVNIARFLNVDSESALKRSNRKFQKRFRYVEEGLARENQSIDEATLGEMEAMWQKAKQDET
jgi:MazG family protein